MAGVFSKGKVEHGILRADLDNFEEFFQFSQWFHEGVGRYYFRGQANFEWDLVTTLERFEAGLYKHAKGTGAFILKDFKRLLRGKGLLANMDHTSDEELLALGQHYGLPTPLLDFSESLYIALFFAYCDEIPDSVDRVCVWAIQTSASQIMDQFNEKSQAETHGDDFLSMKFVDPYTDVNNRLVSQSGLFLQKPSGVSVEGLVAEYCTNNTRAPVLAKITLPVKERESVLNNLLAMNISYSTIYPGIEGAALHAKMKLQLLSKKAERMGVAGVNTHVAKNIRGDVSGSD